MRVERSEVVPVQLGRVKIAPFIRQQPEELDVGYRKDADMKCEIRHMNLMKEYVFFF